MNAPAAKQPVRRELQLLVGALVMFLAALVAAMFALAISILRIDSAAASAEAMAAEIASTLSNGSTLASGPLTQLQSRLELLLGNNDVQRIEVHRAGNLLAAAGQELSEAEVITRPLPNGRIVFYFPPAAQLGGRRTALVGAGLVTLAAVAGLLILIVYVPKFLRPVDQLLAEADRITEGRAVDDDARHLVQTFRDAVERVERQASEIEQLRSTATDRTPNLTEIIRSLDRNFRSGFMGIDAAGGVLSVNDAARQILRMEGPAEATPRHIDDFGESEFVTLLRESFATRNGVNRREVRLADGETVVGCTTVPLFDESVFLGMLVLFVDVTAARAMESRLRDVESLVALGQMSAGIAHEFRNSLSTILGYLQLAARTATDETAARIRNAETEARSLAGVVDALLSFTKPLHIRAQRVRLDEITASAVERFSNSTSDVRFVSGSMDRAEMMGDRDLLDRALENIVRNAIDAVRERHPNGGGVIEASTVTDPHPAIEIRDNGVGIDPEHAASYLLPFQSGKAHGIGLGLPLARKIVLHHGGTLTLTSTPGQGTVVRMEFFT